MRGGAHTIMKYIATKSFRTTIEGEVVSVTRGVDIVDEHHELYRRFPENWEPAAEFRDVEQATAAPGEKRGSVTIGGATAGGDAKGVSR
jgi:hypothetical protein